MASISEERKGRILWLGCQVAKHSKWLIYNDKLHQFQVGDQYQEKMDDSDTLNSLDLDNSMSGVSTLGSGQTSIKALKGGSYMMDIDDDFTSETATIGSEWVMVKDGEEM